MALPAAAQAVKDRLVAESMAPSNEPVAPATPVTPVPTTGTESQVTISRDEFNELQAAADRVKAAEGRAEALKLDLEAFQGRLTDLEKASKDRLIPVAPEPVTPAFPVVAFTEKEETEYGESREFIEKVVMQLLAKVLPDTLQAIDTKLAAVEDKLTEVGTVATTARKGLTEVTEEAFTEKVKEKVGNFDEVVNNKYWDAFCDATEPVSGFTYAQCIVRNLQNRNLDGMINVFNVFKTKYEIGKKPNTEGYQGANPSGTTDTPQEPGGKEILKFSDRKALSIKFQRHEINNADYEVERKRFDLADKEGRLDYTK